MLDVKNPFIWVAGSLLLATIATNATWLALRRFGPKGRVPEALAAIGWLARALFLLLPPLAAWRTGAISPFALGLSEIDWAGRFPREVVTGAVFVAVLVSGWAFYRRSLLAGPSDPLSLPALGRALRAPVDAILSQWHLTFYRAAALGWLAGRLALPEAGLLRGASEWLAASPIAWGAWFGLALAGIEWLFNPFARAALRKAGGAEAELLQVALAVGTAGLFAVSRNFWLCAACHIVAQAAIAGWLRLPEYRPVTG